MNKAEVRRLERDAIIEARKAGRLWMQHPCTCGAMITRSHDPVRSLTVFQHGPNPEAVYVVSPDAWDAFEDIDEAREQVRAFIRRVHAYESRDNEPNR